MSKIFTHLNLDLDASASSWFWLRLVNPNLAFEFRPANWDGAEMVEGDVALDIEAGGRGQKGVKDSEARVHSCFASLLAEHGSQEAKLALRELSAFVDAQDMGHAPKNLGVTGEAAQIWAFTGVNAVLRGFQSLYPFNDLKVAERMFEVFDGLYKSGLSRAKAEAEADLAEMVTKEVAIIRNARQMGTNAVLFERGAKIVVFLDGNNIGLVRRDDVAVRLDDLIIKEITKDEAGWFFHPAGFLAARGTRKAPAETPSGIRPEILAQAAVLLLSQKEKKTE